MTSEFDTVVTHLDTTDTIAIVTRRQNGEPKATPIWSVVVEGVPYLRAPFGEKTWWYRQARSGRPVAIALGDGKVAESDTAAALQQDSAVVSVEDVAADDPVQSAIDDALRTKYSYSPGSRDAMLTEVALSNTLRVIPAH